MTTGATYLRFSTTRRGQSDFLTAALVDGVEGVGGAVNVGSLIFDQCSVVRVEPRRPWRRRNVHVNNMS